MPGKVFARDAPFDTQWDAAAVILTVAAPSPNVGSIRYVILLVGRADELIKSKMEPTNHKMLGHEIVSRQPRQNQTHLKNYRKFHHGMKEAFIWGGATTSDSRQAKLLTAKAERHEYQLGWRGRRTN